MQWAKPNNLLGGACFILLWKVETLYLILFQCVAPKREEETNKEINQQMNVKSGVGTS